LPTFPFSFTECALAGVRALRLRAWQEIFMWLINKLRSARDWLFSQLVASALTQVQAVFLQDAADCAVNLAATAKQLDELGLKEEAKEIRRQLSGMLSATPPTVQSAFSTPEETGDKNLEGPAAPKKLRRSIPQETNHVSSS
jgi:hypothetical protein